MLTYECKQCNIAWHADQHQLKILTPYYTAVLYAECIRCGSRAESKRVGYKCECGNEWRGLRYDEGMKCKAAIAKFSQNIRYVVW